MNLTPSEFAKTLNENVVELKFEKLNGAIRDMIGTRRDDMIPEDQKPKEGWTAIDDTVTSVPVFDMKVCGWRSVRPSSVIEMKTV